jgi:hypothetical protein
LELTFKTPGTLKQMLELKMLKRRFVLTKKKLKRCTKPPKRRKREKLHMTKKWK